jgi:hypothetical protein
LSSSQCHLPADTGCLEIFSTAPLLLLSHALSISFLCFFYMLPRGAHTVCCRLAMIASTAPCFFLGIPPQAILRSRAVPRLLPLCWLPPAATSALVSTAVNRVPPCLRTAPRQSPHCLAVHFAGLCRIAEHHAVVYHPRHRAEAAVCAQPPSSGSRRDAVRRARCLCSALATSTPSARCSCRCQPPW